MTQFVFSNKVLLYLQTMLHTQVTTNKQPHHSTHHYVYIKVNPHMVQYRSTRILQLIAEHNWCRVK